MQPGATEQYYPLVHSVFCLEYLAWGDSPLGYHLVNILLHIISALLLVMLLRRLAIPGAWLAAMIYALHPVQVESVAWITELKNSLSTVFFLGAILAYMKFDLKRGWKGYSVAWGLFVLGLMSKTAIVPLPLALLAILWWKRGRLVLKRDVAPVIPFLLAGMATGIVTVWVERTFVGTQGGKFVFPIVERCLIAGRAFWFYLSKIFWPADLMFIYPRWNINQGIWWQYLFLRPR